MQEKVIIHGNSERKVVVLKALLIARVRRVESWYRRHSNVTEWRMESYSYARSCRSDIVDKSSLQFVTHERFVTFVLSSQYFYSINDCTVKYSKMFSQKTFEELAFYLQDQFQYNYNCNINFNSMFMSNFGIIVITLWL